MKKILGLFVLVFLMTAGCFTSFAAGKEEYKIYYVDFWVDEYDGTAIVEWSRCEASTAYTVDIMRAAKKGAAEKSAAKKKVSSTTDSLDVTSIISQMGTGYYRAVVIPEKAKTEFETSDTIYVDNETLNSIRKRRRAMNGWVLQSNGKWNFYRSDATLAVDCWELINGKWYRFDDNGDMLTGWVWVRGNDGLFRCYYMDPNGACQMGGVTPDGYTVDANGAWTVNGVVQIKKGP